jgi:hypothetical protein
MSLFVVFAFLVPARSILTLWRWEYTPSFQRPIFECAFVLGVNISFRLY